MYTVARLALRLNLLLISRPIYSGTKCWLLLSSPHEYFMPFGFQVYVCNMEGFSRKGGKVAPFLSSGCVLKFAQSSVYFLVVLFSLSLFFVFVLF